MQDLTYPSPEIFIKLFNLQIYSQIRLMTDITKPIYFKKDYLKCTSNYKFMKECPPYASPVLPKFQEPMASPELSASA